MERYDGELIVRFEFDGDFQSNNNFDGESSSYQVVKEQDPYMGDYEFTPSNETQVINIVNKTATENIIINPIPQNYGLISWNGSSLTVE